MSIADSQILNSYQRQYVSGNWNGAGISLPCQLVFERINQMIQLTINSTSVLQGTVAGALVFSVTAPADFLPEVQLLLPVYVSLNSSSTPQSTLGTLQIGISGAMQLFVNSNVSNSGINVAQPAIFPNGAYIGVYSNTVSYSINF